QLSGKDYDPLAVTDKMGKGKSTVEQTAKETDPQSKASKMENEEKPAEKDKTEEKTKYNVTDYMSVQD
ncbi:hypothetical protein PMAYCL1PPCAC_23254, partial [Pristionchus mayeri]